MLSSYIDAEDDEFDRQIVDMFARLHGRAVEEIACRVSGRDVA
jgi:hypothetical protein